VSCCTPQSLARKQPLLNCPACHNRLDVGFGEFCPECGARALQRGGSCFQAQCLVCGRTLSRGESRHYKIGTCTHCGVMLNEDGL
jgi:ribosomal protein L37AE/L43A